jgi:hypothetical protein
MAIPNTPNTTCDIYRFGSAPPADPDVAGVSCHLKADFRERVEAGESRAPEFCYTHVLLVDATVDVRDDKDLLMADGDPDTVYVPNRNGTPFEVRFVERQQRGTPADHKKVYLDRKQPAWPTNEL